MQTKTFLALFCTLIAYLTKVNDGAPAVLKQPSADTSAGHSTLRPLKRFGGRTPWSTTIPPASSKLFNSYLPIITKKLQAVHKVDKKFKPKPSKVSTQVVNGALHHYLVELPTKNYAHVTILAQKWKKPASINEKHVTVKPQLFEANDPNIQ